MKKVNKKLSLNKNVVTKLNEVKGGNAQENITSVVLCDSIRIRIGSDTPGNCVAIVINICNL